ncbi:hypothetical protein, partial [Dietzia sp. SLG310A2-38A2]|uniref:hypothetical protein n=1 Tax=Dietzia sp. SLG310A2-38A2 TaxID=1630643 RepID=UPI0019D677A9
AQHAPRDIQVAVPEATKGTCDRGDARAFDRPASLDPSIGTGCPAVPGDRRSARPLLAAACGEIRRES